MSSTPNFTESGPRANRAVAPAWHTAIVLLAMLGVSLAGALTGNLPGVRAHGRAGSYVLIMMVEWATVAFIGYGVTLRGITMTDLVGGNWARPLAVLRDLAIAVGFLIISALVINGLGYLLKAVPNQAIRNLLPQGPTEVVLYLALTLSAGFCEEVIFRGYLQRQFTALAGASGGIALQGIAFGASHGYQGWKFMLIITVFGAMFGLLARWRSSLRPGMIAHFLQDGAGGLLARHFRS
jgi:uncharacterized protein